MNDYHNRDRYDRIQKLQHANDFEPYTGNSNVFASITLLLVGTVIGLFAMSFIRSCDAPQVMAINQIRCTVCHSRLQQFAEYFRKTGAKQPQRMAEAVMSTRNPRLMAAIAKVESGGDYTLRNTGYRQRHHGAFQVNPSDWGAVSHDPVLQAKQAEAILSELQGNKTSIKTALNLYGGDKTKKRYASDVLRELREVP